MTRFFPIVGAALLTFAALAIVLTVCNWLFAGL